MLCPAATLTALSPDASAGGQAQGKKAAKEKPKTREELDAELDAYKMLDSKAREHVARNAPAPPTDPSRTAAQTAAAVLSSDLDEYFKAKPAKPAEDAPVAA